jgi:plasmid stabilization system protein ParE
MKQLAVLYAKSALRELDAIDDWNKKTYGSTRARRYVNFLERSISGLALLPYKGRAVDSRPDLRYFTIKRRNRGHGHIAVYTVDESSVLILHIFHTAQDWPTILESEPKG